MNSPIDRALWWIEYVIKYKGAPHLRSAAQDLSWYQLHQLDVVAVLALIVFTVIAIQIKLLKLALSLCCGKKSVPKSGKSKKNN